MEGYCGEVCQGSRDHHDLCDHMGSGNDFPSKLQNNINIITQSSISLIASIGIMFVIITGGIDLSLGYTVGLTSLVSGICFNILNFPLLVVILLMLMLGAVIGAVNGFLIVRLHIPAFIATLSSGYIVFGSAQILGSRFVIYNLPDAVKSFGKFRFLNIPVFVFVSAVVVVVAAVILNRTILGRSLYALGTNSTGSYFSGVTIGSATTKAYVFSAMCAALCGVLFTIRVNSAQPDMGGGTFTFEAVTGCVLGGVNLLGGEGRVSGVIFGVLMLKMIENMLGIMGANPYLYQALSSVIILAAIIAENLKNRYL